MAHRTFGVNSRDDQFIFDFDYWDEIAENMIDQVIENQPITIKKEDNANV